MNGLSLFSGGGIGELAFKHIIPNYRTVGYVDNDEYCCKVIEARIKDGILDDAPIWQVDIREFNRKIAQIYKGKVDWISGGFPCQPFSVAGRQLGEADERNMWPATIETIRIIRPRYVFLENNPGLRSSPYAYTILADLAKCDYLFEWDTISAKFVGADHERKRWWGLATNTKGKQVFQLSEAFMASNPDSKRLQGPGKHQPSSNNEASPFGEASWLVDAVQKGALPFVCRRHDGLAEELEQRNRMLGNGWVPQVVKRILQVKAR